MREILFRGKRVRGGEWVYGVYYGICKVTNKAGDFGYVHLMRQSNDEPLYRVDPETVGQYTGMTDNNGKRIFEGDIIECEWYNAMMQIEHRRHLIIFSSGSFCAEWYIGQDKYNNYLHDTFNRKVIGNIHDNPELLEVEK